jgi:hypothetical protein
MIQMQKNGQLLCNSQQETFCLRTFGLAYIAVRFASAK